MTWKEVPGHMNSWSMFMQVDVVSRYIGNEQEIQQVQWKTVNEQKMQVDQETQVAGVVPGYTVVNEQKMQTEVLNCQSLQLLAS